MAAGALGSVSNRSRHENGDTHVEVCDDVFSDAGSTPAASTSFPKENEQFSSFFPPPPLFLQKALNFRLAGESPSSDSGRFSIMEMRQRSRFPPPPKLLRK